MNKLKLTFLMGICFMSLLSCQNGDEPKRENNVILIYDGLGESVKIESITPISATINTGGNYRYACISENRDSLEIVMNDYDYYWTDKPTCIQFGWTSNYETHLTVYDLKPTTTYYYFVTEDGYHPGDPRKIGPIHSFDTEDINLYVNMGSSVEWCGVNYLENRGEFHLTQFLSNSLFRYNELPEPAYETIQGDWRYPTIQELEELSDICTVTMVDFTKKFVCLTSPGKNNLYVPFTYQKLWDDCNDGYRHLMLIPADDQESGLYISTPYLSQSTYGVKCGDELKEYKLKIEKRPPYIVDFSDCTDFFRWSYIDSTGGSSQKKSGDDKIGVRFVREK